MFSFLWRNPIDKITCGKDNRMPLNPSTEITVSKHFKDRLIVSVFFLWLPDFNSFREWGGKKTIYQRIISVHTFFFNFKTFYWTSNRRKTLLDIIKNNVFQMIIYHFTLWWHNGGIPIRIQNKMRIFAITNKFWVFPGHSNKCNMKRGKKVHKYKHCKGKIKVFANDTNIFFFFLNFIYFFIQRVLISHQFYTHQCIHVKPNRPIHHTTTPTTRRFPPMVSIR